MIISVYERAAYQSESDRCFQFSALVFFFFLFYLLPDYIVAFEYEAFNDDRLFFGLLSWLDSRQ